MKTKWKELKEDEMVYYYGPGINKFHIKSKAQIEDFTSDKQMVYIRLNETPKDSTTGMHFSHITAHRCQIRKIKPKEQKIKLSKKQLAEVWDKTIFSNCFSASENSQVFRDFLKELGFTNESNK